MVDTAVSSDYRWEGVVARDGAQQQLGHNYYSMYYLRVGSLCHAGIKGDMPLLTLAIRYNTQPRSRRDPTCGCTRADRNRMARRITWLARIRRDIRPPRASPGGARKDVPMDIRGWERDWLRGLALLRRGYLLDLR